MTADKNKRLGCDPEPFATNTTQNAPDFIALAVSQQAMATPKAQFQLAGHHVHESQTGSFLVSRQGMSRHCENFHELRKFARMVGVKLPEGDALSATLAGHQAAQDALDQIARGCVAPDLLHARLQAILAAGEPERLRAFCRTLQKRLEGNHVL